MLIDRSTKGFQLHHLRRLSLKSTIKVDAMGPLSAQILLQSLNSLFELLEFMRIIPCLDALRLLRLQATFITSQLLLVNAIQVPQQLVRILDFVLDVGPNLFKHIV